MPARPRNRLWKNDAASGLHSTWERGPSGPHANFPHQAVRPQEIPSQGPQGGPEGPRSRQGRLATRMGNKGPLTQRARRARRGDIGPPDAGVARDLPTADAHRRPTRRTRFSGGDRARRRRPPKQQPSDRQNQHRKKREHICLRQNLPREFSICSFSSSYVLDICWGAAPLFVGWIERSEIHHDQRGHKVDFAALNPPYASRRLLLRCLLPMRSFPSSDILERFEDWQEQREPSRVRRPLAGRKTRVSRFHNSGRHPFHMCVACVSQRPVSVTSCVLPVTCLALVRHTRNEPDQEGNDCTSENNWSVHIFQGVQQRHVSQ